MNPSGASKSEGKVDVESSEASIPEQMNTAQTESSRIATNTLLNLGGFLVSMIVGVTAIPPILKHLGKEQFGILMIVFSVVGYLSPLDLGLGRATTKAVAEILAEKCADSAVLIIWTSLSILGLLGLLGGAGVVAAAPWLVRKVLIVPAELQAETQRSLLYVAGTVPFTIIGGALRGALEGAERFDAVNWLKIFSSAAKYGFPLLIFGAGGGLSLGVAGIGLVSALTVLGYAIIAARVFPGLGHPRFSLRVFRAQLRFGMWASVTSGAVTAINQCDRLVLGSMVGMKAVALYAAPQEILNRLTIVPTSVVTVLFPVFGRSNGIDRTAARIHGYSVKFLLLVMVIIASAFIVFADRLLTLWIGADFGSEAALVLRILTIGIFFNSIAYPSFTLLQGVGRPDITAKLYLIELPVYIGMVVCFSRLFGVAGAAVACTMRSGVDVLCYWCLLIRLAPECRSEARAAGILRGSSWASAFGALSSVMLLIPASAGLAVHGALFVASSAFYAYGVWRSAIDDQERTLLRGLTSTFAPWRSAPLVKGECLSGADEI